MLKIGNKIFRVLTLAGLFPGLLLSVGLPLAASQAGQPAPADHPSRLEPGLKPARSISSTPAEQDSLSLTQKLHLWLTDMVEPRAFEASVKNSQSILISPGFDLYLLELWLKGRPLEALLLLDHKLNNWPEAPALLNQAGAFLFSLNEYNLAKEFLTAASSRAPGQVSILNNLGATSAALGLRQEAASYYRQGLELDPYQPEASFGLYQLSSLEPGSRPDQNWLIKALRGGYQDKIARLIELPSVHCPFF
jgi:tetratricopeptide (TPR) repeat protein